MVWGFIIVVIGFFFVYASVAEMASMAPTSGGQYHWVSEFSPRSCQKFLSFLTGWLCFTGWQAAIVAIAFLAGTVIQGLAILNNPKDYIPEAWHGTMLVIAITFFAIIFNTFLANKLPLVEGLVLALHVVGMFAIIIPLWILAPRNSAKEVFTHFQNNGGWSSMGTSFMVGLLSTTISMLGFDCTVHMSEEIRDASRTLPRSIMGSVALNATLGFLMIITLCFCLGNQNEVLASATGYPFIEVFYATTGSKAGTNVMVSIAIITLTGSCIAEVATASRQLWSFARDKGVPFSGYIAKVHPTWNIPLNAVFISFIATVLLSLINIGSTAALFAIFSLTTGSILMSYMICIVCILIKRFRGEPLPARRWSLGKWGMPINIIAMCFLLPVYVFSFFPAGTPTTPETMNWGVVLHVFMVGWSTVYYFTYGRHVFVPPVSLVHRDEY
jgi:amino acid transporter